MQIFDLTDCAPQPWKNGQGATRELCRADRAEGDVIWRLSVAEIERDGPFSRFPGLMRWQVILAGAGLDLIGAEQRIRLHPFEPVQYSGDLAVAARLAGGACRALNLIYDPDLVQGGMDRIAPGAAVLLAPHSAVFVAQGQVRLGAQDVLQAGQGAVIDAPCTATAYADAQVFRLTLTPR